MNLVLKNINFNNIKINNSSYKFYKIYYKTNYTKITGIPISINIKNVRKNIRKNIYNNLYHIIIEDKNTLDLLNNIGHFINEQIKCMNILRKYNNTHYILCNNIYSKNISDLSTIDINIKYIKYINNIYVPMIYII